MTEHPKTLTVVEARANLSELLGEVFYTGQPIVIERHGKPMAVVINPELFARFQVWQEQQEVAERPLAATEEAEHRPIGFESNAD